MREREREGNEGGGRKGGGEAGEDSFGPVGSITKVSFLILSHF